MQLDPHSNRLDIDALLARARTLDPELDRRYGDSGLVILDSRLVIVAWSKGMEKFTRITPGEAVGYPLFRLWPRAMIPGAEGRLGTTLRQGVITAGEGVEIVTPTNRYGLADVANSPVWDTDRLRVLGVASVLRPLTRFREAS